MFQLKNGMEMPKLALGTYLIKGNELFKSVEEALKAGYRSFDTAKYYENEKDLGDALKTLLPRHQLSIDDVFLTSKIFPYSTPDARELIVRDVEESLQWLGRTYLDVVLVHYPRPLDTSDDDARNKEFRKGAWLTLEQLKNEGRIRAIGVSNYEIRHLEEMREYQTTSPEINQCEYHPHFQRTPLKRFCQRNDVLFQAFSPLGRQNRHLLNDETLAKIAAKHRVSSATLILAWIMRGKVGVVAKSATPSRIVENFAALKLDISDEEFETINGLDRQQPYVEDNGWECI